MEEVRRCDGWEVKEEKGTLTRSNALSGPGNGQSVRPEDKGKGKEGKYTVRI